MKMTFQIFTGLQIPEALVRRWEKEPVIKEERVMIRQIWEKIDVNKTPEKLNQVIMNL